MSTVPPGLERQIRATARQITRQAKVPIPNAPHNDVIYGTVTAVASTFPVTVTLSINGDAVNTLAGVACLNSYKPKVGDIVFCSKYGPDLVVVDKLPQRFTASIVQNSSALTGGSTGSSGSTPSYSIPFTPTTIGNLVLVFTGCSGTAAPSTFPTVSGGGVTTWNYGIQFGGLTEMVQVAWGVVTSLGSSPVVVSSYSPGGTTVATNSRVIELSANYAGTWSDSGLGVQNSSTGIGGGSYGNIGYVHGASPCIGIYVACVASGYNGPGLYYSAAFPAGPWWAWDTGFLYPRTTMALIIDLSVNIGDYLDPQFATGGVA